MRLMKCVNNQQDRKRTYNVTLRRFCLTTVAGEKHYVLNNMSV